MRKPIRYIPSLALLALTSVALAQPDAGTPVTGSPTAPEVQAPTQSVEELHDALRVLKTTMEEALNARDIDAILANVDDNVVFTTMNGDVVRGKDGVREYFVRMMTGPDRVVEQVTTHFEADDLSILHGGDTAVAFGHTDDHYVLTDGSTFDIQARWSGTMLLRDKKWIVASFHYSTNMFDNPILDTQRSVMLGVAGLLVVAAAGLFFFLGRRSGRSATA